MTVATRVDPPLLDLDLSQSEMGFIVYHFDLPLIDILYYTGLTGLTTGGFNLSWAKPLFWVKLIFRHNSLLID